MTEPSPYQPAIDALEVELAGLVKRASAIQEAIDLLRAADPNALHCSKCGSAHNRFGQRYCHDCHAAANREFRRRRGALPE